MLHKPTHLSLLKVFYILELLFLLGGGPVVIMWVHAHAFRHGVLFLGCAYAAIRMRGLVRWRSLFASPQPGWWRGPLVRGCVVFFVSILYVYTFEPQHLFALPLQKPHLWLIIICLYPLLSVPPQELIYRVWIFEGYARFWPGKTVPIVLSVLLFAWVHIIYAGWFGVLSSGAAGCILAWSYSQNREKPGAVWPLFLEHALYGLSMFTVGLGQYFYMPR